MTAAHLLAEFEKDALHLTHAIDEDDRMRPIVLRIMEHLLPIVGKSEAKLCVGVVAHEGNSPFSRNVPPAPLSYDFIVVTGSFLTITSGYLNPESGRVFPEVTYVRAINKITAVTQLTQPGMPREYGPIATHHDIRLTFADGSTETLPGIEEELSPVGCKRTAELLPMFYSAMAS